MIYCVFLLRRCRERESKKAEREAKKAAKLSDEKRLKKEARRREKEIQAEKESESEKVNVAYCCVGLGKQRAPTMVNDMKPRTSYRSGAVTVEPWAMLFARGSRRVARGGCCIVVFARFVIAVSPVTRRFRFKRHVCF